MTKPCVVPNCKTGSRSLKTKRSVFKVPSNSERLKEWQSAIPNKQLTSSHFVCENHFEEQYILRKYIRHDTNGRVMAEVVYKHPRLTETAIPTIFDESKEKSSVKCNVSIKIEPTDDCINGSTDIHYSGNCVGISPGHDSFIESAVKSEVLSPIDIDTEVHSNDVSMYSAVKADPHWSHSINDTPVHGTEILITNITGNVDLSPDRGVEDIKVDLSPATSLNTTSADSEDGVDFIGSLPEPWVVSQLSSNPDQRLVFLYPEIIQKCGMEIPITAKIVTVDRQKNIRYFVHGKLVDNDQVDLRQKLDSLTDLPDILFKFQHMKLCCGLGEIDTHFLPTENTFKNYTDQWHHKKCSLLWKHRRCENCYKLRKIVLRRIKRTKNLLSRCRIPRLSNPLADQKMEIIKDKLKCERRARDRVMCQLSILQNSLKAHQLQIAAMKDGTLEERCSKLSVPDAHITAMKEIIAVASSKNSNGRRYCEDWIMMCMSMNKRKPRYYEFLRKNNVMPLPSKRTLETYFSLNNTKCGFDANITYMLNNSVGAKTPIERRAVCSKNLKNTDVGLTECGDNGPQSSNLQEQANYSLVMTSVYVRPTSMPLKHRILRDFSV